MEPVAEQRPGRTLNSASCVGAVVPVLDEAEAIGGVVAGLLANGVDVVVVADGNSRDNTAERARAAGADVVIEPRRGYGRAMMTGIAALPCNVSIVLFFDGDGSDRPELVPLILAPLRAGTADFVMGSRLLGDREQGALRAAQIVAGHMAGILLRLFYGVRFTDMSPFHALRRDTLEKLGMRDTTFGWNLEMQMRIAANRLRVMEIPVGQRRRRGGVSKVSGNWLRGLRAAYAIVRTFARLAWELRGSQAVPK